MVAPASIQPKQGALSIEMPPILFRKDLSKPKDKFPSVHFMMDDSYFTLEELIETME